MSSDMDVGDRMTGVAS